MNEIAHIEQQPRRELSEVERVAMAIAKGGLFGQVDANAVLTLCYLAQAEGQHPAVVFRDYHIIQGKPAKKAEAILRDFISGGGKVEWHRLDDECADATFSHPSGTARIDWTMERAKQAGLATPMWRKYPRQMLRSRVISEGVRTVFPGATSGLYEENEVHDIVAQSVPDRTAEGHSNESAVSPQSSDLKEQLQESVEQAKDYPFPEGPATGITQLKALVRPLWREIVGCGDETELDPLLEIEENKAIIEQCKALENPTHLRELWEGDGRDNPGLSGLIEGKRKEFKLNDMKAISGGAYQEEPA